MKGMNIQPITIDRVLQMCDIRHHVSKDLIVCDIDAIPMPEEMRQMSCTFVGLCTGGEGHYSVGTIEHRVQANDVIFVPEGQVLGDIRMSKDMVGEAMLISHDFLHSVIRDVRDVTNLFVFARENPVLSLTDNEVQMFKEYVSLLRKKVDDQGHHYRLQIAGTIIGAMIYDLCNVTFRSVSLGTQRMSKAQEVFQNFIKLVEKHFRTERRVGWYSEQLNVSPKTLLEMVKRVSQRTPNEWLDVYTTLEIRLLLRHTTKSIKEISEELGFGTQSSLGKFFREHTGVSPTSYRHS